MLKMIILGFEEGDKKLYESALDYLTKLQTRQRIVENTTRNKERQEFKALEIDQKQHKVLKHGKEISLTSYEYRLLCCFVDHADCVLTKRQLYNATYDEVFTGNIDNVIYCQIRKLRRKLETDSRNPEYIVTVHGMGYKFQSGRT